jgi:hypothetical protein
MRVFSERFGWKPIDTAPIDQDVALIVTDGGEPYSVNGPLRLTAAGWVSSGKGTPLAVTPLQWKPYVPRPKKCPRGTREAGAHCTAHQPACARPVPPDTSRFYSRDMAARARTDGFIEPCIPPSPPSRPPGPAGCTRSSTTATG